MQSLFSHHWKLSLSVLNNALLHLQPSARSQTLISFKILQLPHMKADSARLLIFKSPLNLQYGRIFPRPLIRSHAASLISTGAGTTQKFWQLAENQREG